MPSDANGVYSLPSGYLGTTGNTIQVSQHNPPLEDLASAMTARMPRNGAAPMTGPLKLPDGTSTNPALTFSSDASQGLYKTAGGFRGVGLFGIMPIGSVIDFAGATPPDLWLLCYGQSLLRADYPELFTAIGTTHGAVDGTHFSLPDLRGVTSVGKLNMGGVSGTAIDTTTYGADPTTLGVFGGVKNTALLQGHLPAVTLITTISAGQGSHLHNNSGANSYVKFVGSGGGGSGDGAALNLNLNSQMDAATLPAMSGTTPLGGNGTAISRIQPSVILNKIIFAGV